MGSEVWKTSGITLRGMPTVGGDGFDALHPERWSHPPPAGAQPIIPYEGAEEDARTKLATRAQAAADREPLPRLPMRRVMPSEERRLLAKATIVATIVIDLITAIMAIDR